MSLRIDESNVEDVFMYHAPEQGSEQAHLEVQEASVDLAKLIIEVCPSCPETTLAIRRLQEAKMWANAAIAHEGKY